MSSSSMPEQEHRRRRSTPETVTTMASDDPTAARSAAATMAVIGDEEEEEVMGAEGPLDGDGDGDGDLVLVGTPCGEVLLAPTPLSSMKQDDEVSAPPPAAAANGEKQCVQCGATQTPQWRMQPTGRGALCNACRIRLRPAEALREPVHVLHFPPPATATAIIAESPAADGWISEAWMDLDDDAYLLKKKSPSPSPTTEPALMKLKTQKRKRKPCVPWRKPWKQCDHCKTTSTPKWRKGPRGPSTLCNACGLDYIQGQRLHEEYRPLPAASPSLKPPGEHRHREVLQLREKKHGRGKEEHQPTTQPAAAATAMQIGMEQHLPPPPAQAHAGGHDELPMGGLPETLDQSPLNAIDGLPETLTVYDVGGDLLMGDPSSLDQFLFDGPAAPPLIDDDDD